MAEVFKVPAPVGETKRRLKRPASPQPSTSSEPQISFVEYSRRHIWQSVYAHLNEHVILNEIAQIRGMKTGRRQGRRRGIQQQTPPPIRVCDALRLKEPFLMSEIVIQQGQQAMVSSALDHFADVINHIVDQAENTTGTPIEPPTPFLQRPDVKRMFADIEDNEEDDDKGKCACRCTEKAEEEKKKKPVPPLLETAVAVAAIIFGEKVGDAETDLIVD